MVCRWLFHLRLCKRTDWRDFADMDSVLGAHNVTHKKWPTFWHASNVLHRRQPMLPLWKAITFHSAADTAASWMDLFFFLLTAKWEALPWQYCPSNATKGWNLSHHTCTTPNSCMHILGGQQNHSSSTCLFFFTTHPCESCHKEIAWIDRFVYCGSTLVQALWARPCKKH